MAESIVRLRVESSEYDAKLRRAADGLRTYVDNAKKAGESVSQAGKDTLEFVKALGDMDTVSRNAKGKLSEMTKAFTELSVQYKNLTQEEKNSPFGQALSNSLDKLKTRINESKNQLTEVNRELGNTNQESQSTGGSLENLASKFGLNVGQLTKFAAVAGVATTALSVAKDAFFASESQVDEWGRTVESGTALYEGFLQALNSGDFGGFISNMSSIISKAREAYDALDNLRTMMTIINPERAKIQSEQTRLRGIIRREGKDSEAGKDAQKALERLEPRLQKAYKKEAEMNRNVFEKRVDLRLAEGGIVLDSTGRSMLMRAFEDSDFAEQLKKKASGSSTKLNYSKSVAGFNGFGNKDTRNIYQKVADLFTDDWREANSSFLTASYNALNQSYGVGLSNARYLSTSGGGGTTRTGGGGGGGGGTVNTPPPTGSIVEQEAKVQALTKAWREATDQAGRDGYLAQLEEAKKKLEEMQGKTETLVEGSMKALNKELSDLQEAQSNVATASEWNDYEEKIKAVKKQMSELKGEVQEMATGFSGFNDNTISAWLSGQQSSLGGKEIGSADYMQTAGNIIDTQTLQNVVNATLKAGIKIDPEVIESLFEQILGGENIPDSVWQELEDNINTHVDEMSLNALKIDVETGNVTGLGKQVKESWQDAAKAVQSVGSALQQLDDPAAKIAGIIGQAIAQIALGFAQATASDSKLGVFGWIAAIAGGLGTMISTIAAIHSATGYAEGGIVKGNSYSGDNLWGGAYVNAGELVLNRAQQGALASQLDGASESGSMKPYTTGEYIYLGVKNHLSRSGQGEIVTTSMLKKMGLI